MTVPRLIVRVDASNDTFQRSLRKIKDPQLHREVIATLRELFLVDLDAPPAKLHLHQLTGKAGRSMIDPSIKVPIWSIHVTSNDAYKASCWRRCRFEPHTDRRLSHGRRTARGVRLEFRCAPTGSPQTRRMVQISIGANRPAAPTRKTPQQPRPLAFYPS
uniref:Uncharacterized protein n=1 Tax=mine drainage metagenome TaxID=410659 RepID=E6PN12_9ZZZZ